MTPSCYWICYIHISLVFIQAKYGVWTCWQPFTLTFNPLGNLESPVHKHIQHPLYNYSWSKCLIICQTSKFPLGWLRKSTSPKMSPERLSFPVFHLQLFASHPVYCFPPQAILSECQISYRLLHKMNMKQKPFKTLANMSPMFPSGRNNTIPQHSASTRLGITTSPHLISCCLFAVIIAFLVLRLTV